MYLPRDRPTVQQAIEGLKIHQLRKENALIFDDIKHLQTAVGRRQSELDDVLKQVSDLKSTLSEIEARHHKLERKTACQETTLECIKTNVTNLQQEQIKIAKQCNHVLELHQTTIKKFDETMKKVNESFTSLHNRFESFEAHQQRTLDDIQQSLLSKADGGLTRSLEEKLGQVVQELEKQQQSLSSVSKVTDTFEHAQRLASASPVVSENKLLSSFLQPLDLSHEAPNQKSNNILSKTSHANPICQVNTISSPQLQPEHQVDTDFIFPTPKVQDLGISNISHQILKAPSRSGRKPAHPDASNAASLLAQMPSLLPPTRPDERSTFPAVKVLPINEEEDRSAVRSPQTIVEALEMLLVLKQQEQDLVHYFNALLKILLTVPRNEEIDSICLNRFVNGISDNWCKTFVGKWLKSSQHTLQNTRDCVVLLNHCLDQAMLLAESGSATVSCKHHQQRDLHNAMRCGVEKTVVDAFHTQANGETTDQPRFNPVQSDEEVLGSAVARNRKRPRSRKQDSVPNVMTRAARAAEHKFQDEAQCNNIADDYAQEALAETRTEDMEREIELDTNVKGIAGSKCMTNNQTERVSVQTDTARRVERINEDDEPLSHPNLSPSKSPRRLTPRKPTRHKAKSSTARTKQRTTFYDSNSFENGRLASSPPSYPKRTSQSTIRRSPRLLPKSSTQRVPALVTYRVLPKVTVPETSDTVHLPTISRPCQSHQRSFQAHTKRKRKTKHHIDPKIPILSLTNSDLY